MSHFIKERPLSYTQIIKSSNHSQDHGNYKFGYDINDGKRCGNRASGLSSSASSLNPLIDRFAGTGGNHFHKESGDEYGNKRGSYGILDPYTGQMRIVHYIADGVKQSKMADLSIRSPGELHR